MAKLPSEILDRQVIQNFRTSGDSQHVQTVLPESAASGEIIVQLADPASGTSLWTLAKDGETAVQFVNKETVAHMIETGASDAVDNIIDGVGLDEDGTYKEKSGTNYLDSATTVEEEIASLDEVVGLIDEYVGELKITAVTPSETSVKEEYALVSSDGTPIGDTIKIYKDSSLYRVYLGHVDDALTSPTDPTVIPGTGDTALCFIYLKTDGTYELVAVDVEEFLEENEFASGVTATDHIVHGVVDPTSEEFLTVGADGFKLSGVQDAIDLAVEEETERAESAEIALDSVVGAVKSESGETRTYGHTGTNYLDSNTNVKADTELVDTLLGKEVSDPASSADTVFDSTNTVAKTISDIKKDIAAFKNRLSLSGVENAYAKVTIVSAETGTTIEVSAITQSIATASAATQGLADSYDVRTFAVSAVDDTSLATSAGVQVKSDADGDRVLDFSNLKVDCGTF